MTQQPADEQVGPSTGDPGRRRRHRRAVRRGVEEASDDSRAWEDDDRAWGDVPREGGDRDEDRIRREVPPHWS